MTPEQKKRIAHEISNWRNAAQGGIEGFKSTGERMAALLQELVDAPTPAPFGYFKAEPFGWTDCAETDDGAIALFAAPPAPSVPDGWKLVPVDPTQEMMRSGANVPLNKAARHNAVYRAMLAAAPMPAKAPADVERWIDPNDKTQEQFLPHIGERVLFCRDGKTYYGKHTGGSFISFTNPGKNYPTWDCHWMYPPKAIDAAMSEKGQS